MLNNKNNNYPIIEGYGGGGSSRTPVEAKDTLFSSEYARILDLISEGEIKGLVNGLKSIYLDDTPLQNADGSYNFEDVVVDMRLGTQIQTPIPNFPASENEQAVNLEVKHGIPITRRFTNEELTSVTVRITTPALMETNKENGDISGYSIPFSIELQVDDGVFKLVHDGKITGKTTAPYSRSINVSLPSNASSWTIRVSRLNKESTTTSIQDKLYVSAFTEVIDANLSYPNSALIGIHVLAEQFSNNVPRRGYEVYGIKVKIPSNYNPYNRTYSGTWDGSFKVDWTDNPAWIFYALATHPLYGLGGRIKESQLDKWGLYQIARHCDQLVPDGKGGSEPRFTINTYIQNRSQAYELLQNIASVFRGMVYYASGSVFATSDRPSIESPYIFSPSNVVEGRFNYEGSPRSARYSVAVVGWNDPEDMYRQKYEYVEDRSALARYGYVPTEFNAFGCTSQGQAQRAGRWALLTSNLETQVVTFTVGLEALKVIPGSICAIQDPSKSNNARVSGRISSSTPSQIEVDRDLNESVRVGHRVFVTMPNGVTEQRTISNVVGRVIHVSQEFTTSPQVEGQWAIETDIKLPLYRVLSVTDKGDMQYEIVATEHDQRKFDSIESNTLIESRPTVNWGVHGAAPDAPTDLDIRAMPQGVEGSASVLVGEVSWSSQVARHEVRYRRGSEAWISLQVMGNSVEIPNFKLGSYQLEVIAINLRGVRSPVATLTKSVTGVEFSLSTPPNLRLEGDYTSSWLKVAWGSVPGATGYTVRISALGVVRRSLPVGNSLRFDYSAADMQDDLGPWRDVTVEVMATGPFDAKSDWANLSVSNPQIGPLQGIQVESNTRSILMTANKPKEEDLAGYLYWISDDPNFTPTASNATYDVNFNQIFFELFKGEPLENKDYYVWAAGYDTFGKDNLNISNSYKVKPLLLQLDPQSIAEDMIKDGAFTIAKFAENIKPPVVVTTLPTNAKENDQVILAGTGKLYRYAGGVWKPVIQEVGDIDSLPASKVSGTLTLGQVPTIPTTKLSGTVSANQIAANAVGANQIAANVIEAGHVKARSITSDRLVANSVTANELAANSVTAGKVAAGAIGADQISAGAITASKLTISNMSNLFLDPEFNETYANWTKVGTGIEKNGTGAQHGTYYDHTTIKVKPGDIYLFSAKVTRVSGAAWGGAGGVTLHLQRLTSSGWSYLTAGLRVSASQSGTTVTGSPVTIPAGTTAIRLGFYTEANVPSGNRVRIEDVFVRQMMTGELIVDGSIKTQHITANSIQGDRIAANTLNGDKVIANTLHGNRIQANTITADRLAANTINASSAAIANAAITTAKIADAAITNAKIGNAAITNAKIGNAAITSAKIGDLQVDRIKIANNAVSTMSVHTASGGAFSTSYNSSTRMYERHLWSTSFPSGVDLVVLASTFGSNFQSNWRYSPFSDDGITWYSGANITIRIVRGGVTTRFGHGTSVRVIRSGAAGTIQVWGEHPMNSSSNNTNGPAWSAEIGLLTLYK